MPRAEFSWPISVRLVLAPGRMLPVFLASLASCGLVVRYSGSLYTPSSSYGLFYLSSGAPHPSASSQLRLKRSELPTPTWKKELQGCNRSSNLEGAMSCGRSVSRV